MAPARSHRDEWRTRAFWRTAAARDSEARVSGGMLHGGPAGGQVSSNSPSQRTVDFHENWQKWNPETTYLRSSYIKSRGGQRACWEESREEMLPVFPLSLPLCPQRCSRGHRGEGVRRHTMPAHCNSILGSLGRRGARKNTELVNDGVGTDEELKAEHCSDWSDWNFRTAAWDGKEAGEGRGWQLVAVIPPTNGDFSLNKLEYNAHSSTSCPQDFWAWAWVRVVSWVPWSKSFTQYGPCLAFLSLNGSQCLCHLYNLVSFENGTNAVLPSQEAAHTWRQRPWCRIRWSALPEGSRTHGKLCWMEGWFCTPALGNAGWGTCNNFPFSEFRLLTPGEIQSWREETLSFYIRFIILRPQTKTRPGMTDSLSVTSNKLKLGPCLNLNAFLL